MCGTLEAIKKPLPGARELRDGTFVCWWTELSLVLAIVLVVVLVAPNFLPHGAPPGALDHAIAIVDAERFLGLFQEATVQHWFLDIQPLAIAANWWYGLMHFIVTFAVLIWLFRRRTDSYPLWRNTLAIASVLALVVQALWPATPPRLLDGAAHTPKIVDALATLSSPWSFQGHGTGGIANQYAAMPSMHCVWALWVLCVVVPRVHTRWVRVAFVVYPIITALVIVANGTHFVLDAPGGYLALGAGYAIARGVTRSGRRTMPDAEPRVATAPHTTTSPTASTTASATAPTTAAPI